MSTFERMNRSFSYSILFLICLVFTRCSWIEEFVIINESDKAIYVKYEIAENSGTFSLFHAHPSMCILNSSDEIEWGKEMAFADEDSASNKVSVAIPPRSVLVFGRLQNDKYKSYDQKFINGRTFNLKQLQILSNNKIIDVVPDTFDDHFKKHRGQIRFVSK
ncbi:MAG: alpha amylase C-terminal domain-containing protein [Sphingobacteriaceae bacterium]|nr:alpha amylase C-terminal domain-containing protein [Sphingobacteriaceae bacterium]